MAATDGTTASGTTNPGLLATMLQGALPASLTGWLNPQDPTQTVQPQSTPAQDQQRLAQALQEQQAGSDYSPIRSPWQGLARLAQGLEGGLDAAAVRKSQAAGDASWKAALLKGLGGFGDPAAAPPAPASASAPSTLATTLDPSIAAATAAPPSPYGSQPDASAVPSFWSKALPAFAALQGGQPSTGANPFSSLEQQYKLPPGYLAATASIEDPSGDPNATSPTGAKGLFQFTRGTAAQYGVDPANPASSAVGAARLAADNSAVLTKALGRAPTAGELYLAHQQGAGTAAALLANPNAPAGQVLASLGVSPRNIAVNGGDPNAPAGAFTQKWTSRFDGGGAPPSASPNGLLAAGGAVPPLRGSPLGSISGLPVMAASGMGGALSPATSLGPLSTGQPSAVAATLPPVPQRTDAQGNALNPDGTPTALGFNPTTGMVTAPGRQAITGATGAPPGAAAPPTPASSGQPYGSVPLMIKGQMMTRQQAHDSTIPDVDEDIYDNAAEDAHLIPDASKAPPFIDNPGGGAPAAPAGAIPMAPVAGSGSPSSSVVTGSNVPGAPVPTHVSTASTDMDRKNAGMAPSTAGGGIDRAALLSLLSNPYTPAGVQAMAVSMLQKAVEPHTLTPVAQGTALYDPITREAIFTNPKDTSSDDTNDMKNYAFYTKQAKAAGQTPMAFDAWTTAKARAAVAQGPQFVIDQKGEGAEAAKAGELAATRRGDMLTAADAAPEKIARLQVLGNVLSRTQTGPLAGAEGTVVGVANQLGISPETIKSLGLDPNQAVNNQIAQKLGNELVAGSIGAKNGGFPASNFSVAERQFIEKMFPNIASQPGSNQAVTDVLIAREERNLQKVDEWSSYKQAQRQAGKPSSYEDFEDQWGAAHRNDNIFAPIIQKFQAGAYGPVGAAAPSPVPMNGAVPGATPSAASAPSPNIPMPAVQALKANPGLRGQFDAKYGLGASARILGR